MSGTGNNGIDGEINSIDAFKHLQSTFSSTRRTRPPLMDLTAGEGEEEKRVPLNPAKLQRRESKGGLRRIFTRTKPEKNIVSPVVEESVPPSVAPERSAKVVTEKSLLRNRSVNKTATIPDTMPATPKPTTKPSRMNLRSKSVKHSKPTPKPSPKSSTKSSPKPPIRTSAAWDPPPLFQAYPQAIKHATLSASTLSADSILRISNHRRNNSLRDEIAQTRGNGDGPDQAAAAKKAEKAKTKHQRQISGSISKAEWTQKIFVLVTSGYLLQYAAEGSFDRLPQKMMQLGKDSVAFASDVIPGKHWVLQISQSMDADGTPTADSRSLISRLAFRGSDYRRTATSLLLVLNSAEDMDLWIAVVRREIEALGGKKHVSETGKPKPDDKVMQLKASSSHRYLVQRNPDQFSNPASPCSPSFRPPSWTKDDQLHDELEDASSTLARPLSSVRTSTGHQSITNSVTSHDGRQLESLRDSANRLSYMSSGQRTLITSQGSSAASSPIRESKPNFDEFPGKISTEDNRPRPNAAAINERKRSMQTIPILALEVQPPPKNFRHSTYGPPTHPTRSRSLTIPNFSTPKRYPAARSDTAEPPPMPTIVTTTPTPIRPRDTLLKGTRKPPPAALNMVREFSLVKDSPLPKRAPPAFTPTESPFTLVQQAKASVVDILPSSPSSPRLIPTPPIERSLRRSSLIPVASPELAHLDFQFPRRFSSMRVLRDTVDKTHIAPIRPTPLRSIALTRPLPVPPYIPDDESANTNTTGDTIEKESLSPLPVLANTKQKLRRPTSMQIRPGPNHPSLIIAPKLVKGPSAIASPNSWPDSISPSTASSPAPVTVLSPSFQRLKEQLNPKTVANRRSMPTLVNGPPPAPPPNCALPPLPPGSAGLRSPMGIRNPTIHA